MVEMMKAVPAGIAHRRGVMVNPEGRKLSDKELVRRGARHLCSNSLLDSHSLERRNDGNEWQIRLKISAGASPLITVRDHVSWSALRRLAIEACRDNPQLLAELDLGERARRELEAVVDEARVEP